MDYLLQTLPMDVDIDIQTEPYKSLVSLLFLEFLQYFRIDLIYNIRASFCVHWYYNIWYQSSNFSTYG